MRCATLLVLETDPSLRAATVRQLAALGHDVLPAESAQDALAALARHAVDVVVISHRPECGRAIALLPQLAAKAPAVATVVLSSVSSVSDGVEAMRLGALDFLVRPCPSGALRSTLARAVAVARTRQDVATRERRGDSIVGGSRALQAVRERVASLARDGATAVLVEGETGTGKELVARTLHACGARRDRPWLRIHCAALPERILDAALFGDERGAIPAADDQGSGVIEAARGGTVLLDEMGDLGAGLQAKLLRFLERNTYRRVGGVEERTADVAIVAATQVDLAAAAAAGRFRRDLVDRLAAARVRVPPLRERPEDVAPLASAFLADFNDRLGLAVRGISAAALEALERHPWPGNVRELRGVIERAFVLSPEMEELRPEHLPDHLAARVATERPGRSSEGLELCAAERRALWQALLRAGGNQARAAGLLGITRFALRHRLLKHGLASP